MGFQSPQEVKISCHGGLHKLHVSKSYGYTQKKWHMSLTWECAYIWVFKGEEYQTQNLFLNIPVCFTRRQILKILKKFKIKVKSYF